jgi:hypothetical protein
LIATVACLPHRQQPTKRIGAEDKDSHADGRDDAGLHQQPNMIGPGHVSSYRCNAENSTRATDIKRGQHRVKGRSDTIECSMLWSWWLCRVGECCRWLMWLRLGFNSRTPQRGSGSNSARVRRAVSVHRTSDECSAFGTRDRLIVFQHFRIDESGAKTNGTSKFVHHATRTRYRCSDWITPHLPRGHKDKK